MSTVDKEKSGKETGGFFSKIGKFLRDQKGEMKKVVWPSKKQVANNTVIVIGAVAVAAVVVGGFDAILGAVVHMLFGA